MGLWDKIKGEFIDIIEWTDDSNDTLVYRFERYGNEIKYKSQLTVREGQMAVFINEGQLADVFQPGRYELTTQNMPILTTLKGWKYGFNSPFKAEVYFCSTRQFTDLKWGTPGPVTMRDADFGVVRVTAYGLYSMKISNPETFIKEIVGTDGHFTTDEINENLRGKVAIAIKEAIPEAGIPVIDLEGKVVLLGERLVEKLLPRFEQYGLKITEVQVQDIGLPEEVEKAIDAGGAMRAIGNLQAYTQYRTADAIEDAAKNPGGMASGGMGMGMGFAMANQMTGAMNNPNAGAGLPNTMGKQGQNAPAGPPPIPTEKTFFLAVNKQQVGPFTIAQLKDEVKTGNLNGETLVWSEGMSGWEKASQVAGLASVLGSTPPPIPE